MPDIEALEQGKRVVEESPDDERFDMVLVNKQLDCGTAHCAWGWIKRDPWFISNRGTAGPNQFMIDSRRVFGISFNEMITLFASVDRSGPEIKAEVIANFDRLIAGQPPVPYDGAEDEDEDDTF